MRAVFFEEGQARAVLVRLSRCGFCATCERDRFAGEDDDEDHPWVVLSDAPMVLLDLLVEEYDGWLELDASPAGAAPLELPRSPRGAGRGPRGRES